MQPPGSTSRGRLVGEPNNMFIVYFSGRPVIVYPAGSTRWGQVVRELDGCVNVYAWCVGDMKEVVQAHVRRYTDKWMTWMRICFSSDRGLPCAPKPRHNDLWGKPADRSWSEESWTSLLQTACTNKGTGPMPVVHAARRIKQLLPTNTMCTTWESLGLSIVVHNTAPLKGLLTCLSHLDRAQGRHITVWGGTAGLGEVEACVYTCQQAGMRVQLGSTSILVPDGEEESLRARRDRLCETYNKQGDCMVKCPKWRT